MHFLAHGMLPSNYSCSPLLLNASEMGNKCCPLKNCILSGEYSFINWRVHMFLEQTCLGQFSAMFSLCQMGTPYMPSGAPVSGLAMLQRHIKAAHDCALQEEQARQHLDNERRNSASPNISSKGCPIPGREGRSGTLNANKWHWCILCVLET